MSNQLVKTSRNAVSNGTSGQLSTAVNLNYNKWTYDRNSSVTTININRAVQGTGDHANIKTYTQNIVKKYELSANKEVCIRKILVAEREDHQFDVTVREINVYYRKNKKQQFNKVLRFVTPDGTMDFIFELLRDQKMQKSIPVQTNYLLN